jgi:hypothetical protein
MADGSLDAPRLAKQNAGFLPRCNHNMSFKDFNLSLSYPGMCVPELPE